MYLIREFYAPMPGPILTTYIVFEAFVGHILACVFLIGAFIIKPDYQNR